MPAFRPVPAIRMIRSLARYDCRILLDLEDGIKDPENVAETKRRKQQARKDLTAICAALPRLKFAVRVNALDTTEFEPDEHLLRRVPNITSVFIPKAEDADAIAAFARRHPKHKLHLIAETRKGVANLNALLDTAAKQQIEYVFFGNYDYHLDTDIYPVREQYTKAYWDIASPLIATVERHGLRFGNSPYAQLDDVGTLQFIYSQLTEKCSKPFAMMSLQRWQTAQYCAIANGNCAPVKKKCRTADSRELDIQYRNSIVNGLSFALNNITRRIITPHEYLLWKQQHG